jgi:hypothetical protein
LTQKKGGRYANRRVFKYRTRGKENKDMLPKTKEELEKMDDILFSRYILNERKHELNPYAPLAQKLDSACRTLESMELLRPLHGQSAGVCHVCGYDKIEYGDNRAGSDKDNVYRIWTCPGCGKEGRAYYKLVFIGHSVGRLMNG